MKRTVAQLAVDLIADGTIELVVDELNAEGETPASDRRTACDLVLEIVRALRADPDAALALVNRPAPAVPYGARTGTPAPSSDLLWVMGDPGASPAPGTPVVEG